MIFLQFFPSTNPVRPTARLPEAPAFPAFSPVTLEAMPQHGVVDSFLVVALPDIYIYITWGYWYRFIWIYVYIYKLYCVSIWICIHLWTSSCFEREKFATSLLTTFHVGNFAERNILRSSQRSLRPKSRGHKRLHSVPSDTELLTHCATLPEPGREVRPKTLGETCWNGNTTEEYFSMWNCDDGAAIENCWGPTVNPGKVCRAILFGLELNGCTWFRVGTLRRKCNPP